MEVEIYRDQRVGDPHAEWIVREWKLNRMAVDAQELVQTCASRGMDHLMDRALANRDEAIAQLLAMRQVVGPWGEGDGHGAMCGKECKS